MQDMASLYRLKGLALVKWSVFVIKKKKKNHCAKKTMPSLTQFLKSKNRGFIFSDIFEYMVPVRYGKYVLWRLIRNRSAKYHLLWRTSPFPPLLIRVTAHSLLYEQTCVVLFCKSCMRGIGYLVYSAGVPHTHVKCKGAGQVAGVHTTLPVALSAKVTELATHESPHCGGTASVREAFLSAARRAPTHAVCW